VCNDLLCFLLSKYGKVSNKVLKDILVESFEATVIHEAKIRLLEDISTLGSCDELPYISKDKQGNDQPTDDIDDMYALLILATDHELIDKIPRYVTDKPDLLPGVHLTDGDMRIFVGWLKKMDDRLCGVESTLTAMTAIVDRLGETLTKVQTTMAAQGPSPVDISTAEWPALPARLVINTAETATGFSHGLSTSASALASVSNSSQITQLPRQMVSGQQMQILRSTDDWSTAMSTPQTLAVARNSDGYGLEANEKTDEFTTVRPKRRRRVHSSAEGADKTSDENIVRTRRLDQSSRAPLVYGKAKLGKANARIITAPKSFVSKSVFCVDNIDASFTADDVRNFVSKMSVRVVSCFETKPRKRRSDNSSASTISDRKAFRLCINSDDCEMLLNDSKWPAHVTVSKWFFKPKETNSITNQPEEGRATLDPNGTVGESACSQPPQKLARPDPSNNTDSDDETDMDDTVIVQQSPSADVPVPATTLD